MSSESSQSGEAATLRVTNNTKYKRDTKKGVTQGCLEVTEGFTKEIGLKETLKIKKSRKKTAS